ncbi:MAG TPA: hypothetical protein VKT20_06315 [Candidatus Dormibacteraeota bacterium]|nr:hypothetical protein [Candidatus Dormibacteraeota bacterium]
MARAALTAIALLALGACVPICGLGAKFAISNARVDQTYRCPNPANNLPYDVHGSIDAVNSTSTAVTIRSMSEAWRLVASGGNWNGPSTAKGGGPVTNYEPRSVGSGSSTTIRFSVPFECTNSGAAAATFGEFALRFSLVTSAGTFNIDAGNRHRLNFAG